MCARGRCLCLPLGFLCGRAVSALHGQGDAFAGEVNFQNPDRDFLLDFDNLGRGLDIVVAELADVDQPIVVDPDVNKGAEGGDIGDNAR